MPRRLISTGSPAEKLAGYSRAVVEGDFCFVAGTTRRQREDAMRQARRRRAGTA
jgi:hypothetical protein